MSSLLKTTEKLLWLFCFLLIVKGGYLSVSQSQQSLDYTQSDYYSTDQNFNVIKVNANTNIIIYFSQYNQLVINGNKFKQYPNIYRAQFKVSPIVNVNGFQLAYIIFYDLSSQINVMVFDVISNTITLQTIVDIKINSFLNLDLCVYKSKYLYLFIGQTAQTSIL